MALDRTARRAAREPPAEPAVRWTGAEEDAAAAPRRVALVEVDPFDESLRLHAPTPARLESVEREVRRILGGLIGEQRYRDCEAPDSTFRWQRERWERSLASSPGPPIGQACLARPN